MNIDLLEYCANMKQRSEPIKSSDNIKDIYEIELLLLGINLAKKVHFSEMTLWLLCLKKGKKF